MSDETNVNSIYHTYKIKIGNLNYFEVIRRLEAWYLEGIITDYGEERDEKAMRFPEL